MSCGNSSRGDSGNARADLFAQSLVASEKAMYKATSFRSDPCLQLRQDYAAFRNCRTTTCCLQATHAFADSRAHIACASTEREALTITVIHGCERSRKNSGDVQHVPQNGSVNVCQTLKVFSGGIHCREQQVMFFSLHAQLIQAFSSSAQFNALAHMHASRNLTSLQLQPFAEADRRHKLGGTTVL